VVGAVLCELFVSWRRKSAALVGAPFLQKIFLALYGGGAALVKINGHIKHHAN
jgi:hypothetical protein